MEGYLVEIKYNTLHFQTGGGGGLSLCQSDGDVLHHKAIEDRGKSKI